MVLEARIAERLRRRRAGHGGAHRRVVLRRAGLPVASARASSSVDASSTRRGWTRRRAAGRVEYALPARIGAMAGEDSRLGASRRRSARARGAGVTAARQRRRPPAPTAGGVRGVLVSLGAARRRCCVVGSAATMGVRARRRHAPTSRHSVARDPCARPVAPIRLDGALVRGAARDWARRTEAPAALRRAGARAAHRVLPAGHDAPRPATCAQGIVAADPQLFPLGRYVELYVGREYYGRFLVDDTGGAIQRRRSSTSGRRPAATRGASAASAAPPCSCRGRAVRAGTRCSPGGWAAQQRS